MSLPSTYGWLGLRQGVAERRRGAGDGDLDLDLVRGVAAAEIELDFSISKIVSAKAAISRVEAKVLWDKCWRMFVGNRRKKWV